LTRRLHAYVREGADENSWQSRPRHAVLSPTLGRLPPPRETAADLARVMLLLDVSTIARNVGHDLIFATSCCTHSDLGGCADSDADALPARQTTRLCCWHACASVWIATSFRPRPRMHKHANAWWSLQLHTLCALHTASRSPALASCAATVRPVYVQVQEGRLVQLGRLAAAVLEGDVWCSTRPDLSIRPQPSEQQPAQIQGHVRHARRGEDARPGGCGGSRKRVRPGHRLCSLGCISFHFDSAPPPTSRFASTHAAEANLNASRFCLHGGSCPTPPSCTTAACITHKGGCF